MRSQEQPREDRGSSVRILAVPFDVPIIVRHLAGIQGTLLHWHSSRSVPCCGVEDCPPAIHKARTVWRAYGPVEGWDGVSRLWVPAVIELTGHAEEFTRARDLRGEVWRWSRASAGGKRAPVIGQFCERVSEVGLRPPFDVLPILCRMYNVAEIRMGIPNPIPPRIVMEPVAGAPPNLPAVEESPGEVILSPEQIREQTARARAQLGAGKPGTSRPADRNGH